MMRYQPLRLLSDTERAEALHQVDAALADLREAEDIDTWHREALLHGYRRLGLVLQHFEFFGHSGLTQELVLTTAATTAAAAKLSPTSKTLKSSWAALVMAARIVEVVAAPSVLEHAAIDYYQLARLGGPPPAETLLIAGPTAAEPAPANEECPLLEANVDDAARPEPAPS